MKKGSLILGLVLLIGVLLVVTVSYSNQQLTGDEILQKVDDQRDVVMGGDLVMTMRMDNIHSDGATTSNVFGELSKNVEGQPDKSLIYFKEPEDVEGTIFLSIKPEGEDARLWLYLPALDQVKELISEEQRSGSFAGSTLSYRQVGSRRISDDYTGKLVGEETVTIGERSFDCYVVETTAKQDADVDYPREKLWVGKENWLMLKAEDYNDAGRRELTMEVLKLGEFEGNAVADEMLAKNVIEGSSTTISFIDRHRPESPIPDNVFDADNLANFDPTAWGFVWPSEE